MPSANSLAAFSSLALALVLVPGPSVMFIVGRAVALGRRAALLTVLGNGGGLFAQALLVALGLGIVLERSLAAFTTLKLVGAAYLVWLGIQAIRKRHVSGDAEVAAADQTGRSVMFEGFLVGALNPKSLAIMTALLPQYVELDGAPVGVQMAFLGLLFVLIALIADSAWGLAAGTARNWIARSPKRLERLAASGGTIMILLGLQLAMSGFGAGRLAWSVGLRPNSLKTCHKMLSSNPQGTSGRKEL